MIRSKSQLLLVKKEANQNEDPTPDVTNAIRTGQFIPGYRYEKLQRLIVEKGIDAAKNLIGKEYLDFSFPVELNGSGKVGVAPDWAPLLEACGFKKTVVETAAIDIPIEGYGNKGLDNLAVTSGGSFTGTVPRVYKVEVTTPGESATAKASVECWGDDSQNSIDNAITTDMAIDLGDEGATITFTFATGSLELGDCWYIFTYPAGLRYRPISEDEAQTSLFFYHYLGGLLFKGGGAKGNLNLSARAGKFGSIDFSFNSVFNEVSDASVPSHTFTGPLPPKVEAANCHFADRKDFRIAQIQLETGNSLEEIEDVNMLNGIAGFDITEKDHSFKIDPSAKLEGDFAFWAKFRARKEVPFGFQVGHTPGNIIHCQARRAVVDDPGMNESTNILRYGITGQCRPSPIGNDNMEFFFC